MLATVLSWCLLGQVTLPGDKQGLEAVTTYSHAILVGKLTGFREMPGPGVAIRIGKVDFQPNEMLRGRTRDLNRDWVSILAEDQNREVMPEVGENYVFFIGRFAGMPDRVMKVMPATSANIEATRQAIQADEDRQLPSGGIPITEAHTIVLAEVTAGAAVTAGGVNLGWCEFKVSATVRGDGKAVDGKRIGYTASNKGKPPRVGESFLFWIGKDHGLDAILRVRPASETNIAVAVEVESTEEEIRNGAPRSFPGSHLTTVQAEAKSHTIIVGEVEFSDTMCSPGGAQNDFKVTSTLRGEAKPGDRNHLGSESPHKGIGPKTGESFVFWIGKADHVDIDVILKMLPASAANIEEARNLVMAAGRPAAAH